MENGHFARVGGKVVFAVTSPFTGGLTASDSVTVLCNAAGQKGQGE